MKLRVTNISLMRSIASRVSKPRSQTSGVTPQTSASCRATFALLVAA